jgi:hypothetical protein
MDSGPIYNIIAPGVIPGPPDQLVIDRPYIGPPVVNARYKIFRAPQPVAGTEALKLPEDVVINVSPNATPPGTTPLPPAVTVPVERRSAFIPFHLGYENQTAFNFAWVAGADGQAGAAGVDDDRNGIVDDFTELGAVGTDDVASTSWPPMDILFAPNGLPTGRAADRPMIHVWVEKRGSTTPVAGGGINIDDALLVTLFTRTGLAQSFEVELRDMDNDTTTAEYYFYAEQAFGSATP